MSKLMSKRKFRNDTGDEEVHESGLFVTYGTSLPDINSEEKDKGKYLPVWKQEVRDERGLRRLHGAFKGGWSAGYFNTVGSKEGWTPSSFVSSRGKRVDRKESKPEDFMDEEDLEEFGQSQKLVTTEDFDAFGSTARDLARKRAIATAMNESGSVLGVLPDRFIDDLISCKGIRLLKQMGWREGQGVGPRVPASSRKEDGESGSDVDSTYTSDITFAPKDTQLIQFNQKNNNFGLGYNPYDNAPEFRRKPDESKSDTYLQKSHKDALPMRGGIGVGALEDEDEDYIYGGSSISDYHKSLVDEDEDVFVMGRKKTKTKQYSVSSNLSKGDRGTCRDNKLPLVGFILACRPVPLDKWFSPPDLPAGFTPFHIFDTPGPSTETDEQEHNLKGPDDNKDLQITKEIDTSRITKEVKGPIMYRPMSSMISSRFVSGGSLTGHELSKPEGGLNVKPIIPEMIQKSETQSAKEEIISTAESAARMNMFGPLTRTKVDFYPNRLLCKRFNVADPHPNHKAEKSTGRTEKGQRDVLSKETLDNIITQMLSQDEPKPPSPKRKRALDESEDKIIKQMVFQDEQKPQSPKRKRTPNKIESDVQPKNEPKPPSPKRKRTPDESENDATSSDESSSSPESDAKRSRHHKHRHHQHNKSSSSSKKNSKKKKRRSKKSRSKHRQDYSRDRSDDERRHRKDKRRKHRDEDDNDKAKKDKRSLDYGDEAHSKVKLKDGRSVDDAKSRHERDEKDKCEEATRQQDGGEKRSTTVDESVKATDSGSRHIRNRPRATDLWE
ncbi:8672_t:CDS:10 [Paraglomus occultum]|uniref:8672_t:CDS:1 n=1 Tax=Paraglomus occultum TaxID=144539 RepID=A0A9N9GD50_9GLOM|nr:8672_t:CDS:10 [Paraglomus occultum]